MTLLKQDTGIDVKSASSSIEEIVARQFVERHAKKRNIVLPSGSLFADTPAVKKSGGKAKAAPEPPRPAAPVLRPRLIKTIRPVATPETPEADVTSTAAVAEAAPVIEAPPVEIPEPVVTIPEVAPAPEVEVA